MKNKLYKKEESKIFYDKRYQNGYMEEWPIDKKLRVLELIGNLKLPEVGTALDFGCGNGIFTNVLQNALPNWKVFGCDISTNAINNAKNRYPHCTFFASDNEHFSDLKFDFLFSHHVLEHVFDINKTINEINTYLKPKSSILVILPCGNEDSFLQKLCRMQIDGIDESMENRFFCEDEGHVRRLTTDQTNSLLKEYEFDLNRDFYSNQHFGGIKWFSQSSIKLILELTNPKRAINKVAYKFLSILRIKSLLLFILQLPARLYISVGNAKKKKIKHYCSILIGFIPFLISYPVYFIVNSNAKKEWQNNKHLKNGSEMYLFYSRNK